VDCRLRENDRGAKPTHRFHPFAMKSQALRAVSNLSTGSKLNVSLTVTICVFINIVGKSATDIFSTCVFNNIVGLIDFFILAFLAHLRHDVTLSCFRSTTYLFVQIARQIPNWLDFQKHRGKQLNICAWRSSNTVCTGLS